MSNTEMAHIRFDGGPKAQATQTLAQAAVP
jgi:hypothetical protein